MSRRQGRLGWRCWLCPERGHEETEQKDLDEFEKHYQQVHMTAQIKEEPR